MAQNHEQLGHTAPMASRHGILPWDPMSLLLSRTSIYREPYRLVTFPRLRTTVECLLNVHRKRFVTEFRLAPVVYNAIIINRGTKIGETAASSGPFRIRTSLTTKRSVPWRL